MSSLVGKMHVTHDINELTFMLKSIQQTIVAKFAGIRFGHFRNVI